MFLFCEVNIYLRKMLQFLISQTLKSLFLIEYNFSKSRVILTKENLSGLRKHVFFYIISEILSCYKFKKIKDNLIISCFF